ncbi:uncharacterized protein LOC144817663 isoform X1 [Lissotriton helveticus]
MSVVLHWTVECKFSEIGILLNCVNCILLFSSDPQVLCVKLFLRTSAKMEPNFDFCDLFRYSMLELVRFCEERDIGVDESDTQSELRSSLILWQKGQWDLERSERDRARAARHEGGESVESPEECELYDDDSGWISADSEDRIGRESLAEPSVRTSAPSLVLSPEEWLDRREEREHQLAMEQLRLEHAKLEAERALFREKVTLEGRLSPECSCGFLDSPGRVESSGGSYLSVSVDSPTPSSPSMVPVSPEEENRLRFRNLRKLSRQSWEEFVDECQDALSDWLEVHMGTEFTKLFDLVLREQVLNSCLPGLRQHLLEYGLTDPDTLAKEAERWDSARGSFESLVSDSNNSGSGVFQPSVVEEGESSPARSQVSEEGVGADCLSQWSGSECVTESPQMPEALSQSLDGSFREHQDGNLSLPVSSLEGDLLVCRGPGASVSGASMVLESGSTAPVGMVQESSKRSDWGIVCESPEVLECQALVAPKVLDQRLEGQVQDPPDLKGGTTVISVLTSSFSRGTAPVGREQDSGRGCRGWESPPLTPVPPEGLNPRLGEECFEGTPRRRRSNPRRRGRGRRAFPETPGPPEVVDPRLENQWQSSLVLQTGRVEHGYYVPGVTTPHFVSRQDPVVPGWPRAWSSPRAAGEYQWGSPVSPYSSFRRNPRGSPWRKTGGCPCSCGPASLFYRPKQGSPSRW